VGGDGRTIEIHLLDFQGDLYGQRLRVDVLARLRDEEKFESIEALKAQLSQDELQTRAVLSKFKS
jgi:riboflavin kinase/FMN adenylyltransferase